MLAMDDGIATKIGLEKIHNVAHVHAQGIVTACVFCDIQLTQVQFDESMEEDKRIPIITLPQFLGPALGLDPDTLGVSLNKISPKNIFAAMEAR
jgi:heterodisulfide reductase subunit B